MTLNLSHQLICESLSCTVRYAPELLHKSKFPRWCLFVWVYAIIVLFITAFITDDEQHLWGQQRRQASLVWLIMVFGGWRSDKAAPAHILFSLSSLYLTPCHFLKIKWTHWFNCSQLPSLPPSSHSAHTTHLRCRTYEPLSMCECFLTSVPPRRYQPLHSVIGSTWIKYISSVHKHLNTSLKHTYDSLSHLQTDTHSHQLATHI